MKTHHTKKQKNQKLIAASVAGLMAMAWGTLQLPGMASAEGGDGVPCYGVNQCKGTGECGGKGHSCHGQNACKGQGWISMDADECLSLEDGRLTPEEE